MSAVARMDLVSCGYFGDGSRAWELRCLVPLRTWYGYGIRKGRTARRVRRCLRREGQRLYQHLLQLADAKMAAERDVRRGRIPW